jgi:hypothetical protein
MFTINTKLDIAFKKINKNVNNICYNSYNSYLHLTRGQHENPIHYVGELCPPFAAVWPSRTEKCRCKSAWFSAP